MAKKCTKCKLKKPETEFYFDKNNNRLVSQCIPCFRETSKKYSHSEKGRKKHAEIGRLRYAKEKVKILARNKIHYYVKTGKIIKPYRCESCNRLTDLEAHHEDYAKPLTVIWLCELCHKGVHETLKDPNLIGEYNGS